ncbi:MAG: hypothetical protein ABIZ72_05935, partial [Candidatus Limnocylindrales bacterium]
MSGLPGSTGPRGGHDHDSERRSGDDRRSLADRRDEAASLGGDPPPPDPPQPDPAAPEVDERRSGSERRSGEERRTGDTVSADQLSLGR